MYVKYKDFNGILKVGDILLMSHQEFVDGGKDLINIPVTITKDGEEPVLVEGSEIYDIES